MPHGVLAIPPPGTPPDVYVGSNQKPTLRPYFTRTDKMAFCMTTDSSSDSEDDLFLLAVVVLSFDFAQSRQTEEEGIRIDVSAIFV